MEISETTIKTIDQNWKSYVVCPSILMNCGENGMYLHKNSVHAKCIIMIKIHEMINGISAS